MKKKDEIIGRVADLEKKYNLTGTTPIGVLKHAIQAEWNTLEKLYAQLEKSPVEAANCKNRLETSLKDHNNLLVIQRLEELAAMPVEEAGKSYLENWAIEGVQVNISDDMKPLEINWEARLKIKPADYVKTVHPNIYKGISDRCCVFADNVAKFVFKDDGASVTRNGLSAAYKNFAKSIGFDVPASKLSKNVLSQQLQSIVNAIFPGLGLKVVNPDITHIMHGILIAKTSVDGGSFQSKAESTVIDYVVTAAYHRYFGLAYPHQNQTNGEKAPLSGNQEANPAKPTAKQEKREEFFSRIGDRTAEAEHQANAASERKESADAASNVDGAVKS